MANSTNTFKHKLHIYIGKTRRLSTIFVHSYREQEVVVTYSDLIKRLGYMYIDYVKVWNEAGIEA